MVGNAVLSGAVKVRSIYRSVVIFSRRLAEDREPFADLEVKFPTSKDRPRRGTGKNHIAFPAQTPALPPKFAQ
jgi:hypothetical protein